MNTLPKAIAIFVLVLFGTLASGSAMAQHRGHGYGNGYGHGNGNGNGYGHGYGHGYGYGGNVRFGISLGLPIYAPGYYPAPYYAYPAYAYPAPAYTYPAAVMGSYSPPVYVERGEAQAAPAQARGDWYYCAASRAYYPYVGECPAGWQRLPAQPSSR